MSAEPTAPTSTFQAEGEVQIEKPKIRFGLVLGLLVAIYLCASITATAWMTPVLLSMSAAVVVALAVPTHPRRPEVLLFALAIMGVIGLSILLALLGRRASGFSDLMVAGLLFFGITVILRAIARAKRITPEAVVGVVDVYIMLGLVFGFVYSGLERISNTPFFNTEVLSDRSDFLYFSFVAMTTLGFGDLTPADNYARPLTVVEVLIGQMVLVVVVARVVSMLGPRGDRAVQT